MAAVPVPYFQTVKSFADVRVSNEGVDTGEFLEACDGLVNLFDLFGSAVFGFVQSDIRGNIAGVRARYERRPEASGTLEHFVLNEAQQQDRQGLSCLVLLFRGLAFTCLSLQTMQQNPSLELRACFRQSYDIVLKQYHPFIIRSIVSVAIHAVPKRADFYTCLVQGGSLQTLDHEMTKWLAALDRIVKHIKGFLESGGYGKV